MRPSRLSRWTAPFIACSVMCVIATARETNAQAPTARQARAWTPDAIQWQHVYEDGTKYALLEGRRDVPGESFTYAFYIPPGYWEHHWHSSDARVAVVAGALRLAYGPSLDRKGALSYRVGSYVLVPANTPHTMGAEVPTIIVGTAVGPWKTHRHEELPSKQTKPRRQ